ncbi:hypothetical protein A4G18_00630 [Pasteurellaceae bacterium Pebbles2]|nr:hypothetical protein [Pasteurellaceae bacterium Pebbles2]
MKLYEISERYQNIMDLVNNPELADNTDIQTQLEQTLNGIEDEFDSKVQQTVFVLKNIESEIEPIDAEIKRLQAMKKARQNSVERIKDYLKHHLHATNIKAVNCGVFNVSYREMKQSAVEIDDVLFSANNLDESLVNVKITPNKTAIKQALKDGVEVIGAKLVDSQVLTIR